MSQIQSIRHRRGTAAAWAAANPVLDPGEFGVETDTGFMKMGDGVTAYKSLKYQGLRSTVTAFTTPGSGTFVIPTWATTVRAFVWGSCGGGGGGSRYPATTAHFGGGGAGGAGYSEREFLAADLLAAYPSGVPYTVGAGGAGGAGATADNSAGATGATGGTSFLGSNINNYFELGCGATAGAPGNGGTTGSGNGGSAGVGTTSLGGNGAGSSITATAGGGSSGTFGGGAGGAAGGGIAATPSYFSGGAGNTAYGLSNYGGGGTYNSGGNGLNGGDGARGNKTGPALSIPVVGASGGGGGAGSQAGGNGGAAGMGSGGSGGGASVNGYPAGNGSKGGDGCVVFLCRP